MLHVLNGDAVREKLERSEVPGTLTVWADVLHEGPCQLLPPDRWRRMRSGHLARQGFMTEDQILEQYERSDAQLDRADEYPEVVFWFEHDLFDQLLLIRHLHWISARAGSQTTFSLICIGEFPGIANFTGLGQLRPEQLASLLETRHAITGEEIGLGRRAWTAFCSPDPRQLLEVLNEDTSALPFLDGALRRFLEDYPARGNGLSRSERQILEAAAAGGSTPLAAFKATQQMEERIFMGDWSWWTIVRALASAKNPLLSIDSAAVGPALPDGTIRLSETGHDVLAGRLDHVEINGIDRWMGGVRLTDGRWRWNGVSLEEKRKSEGEVRRKRNQKPH